MIIKMIPNDTLFFRDGKPFTMGDDTWGGCIFPPSPSVIYGAIRSMYIAQNGGLEKFHNGDMKRKIGTRKDHGEFRIKTVYLSHSFEDNDITDSFYFPVPHDIVRSKENNNEHFRMSPERSNSSFNSMPDDISFLCTDSITDDVEPLDTDYLNQGVFSKKYALDFFDDSIKTKELEYFIVDEPKIGFKRDKNTKTTDEGHLYRIGLKRLKNGRAIYVYIEGLEKKDLIANNDEWGIMKLGGEGKTVRFKCLEDPGPDFFINKNKLVQSIFQYKRFKIYFMTPAIFENGWIPDFVDTPDYPFDRIRLVSAAVGKSIQIGGWDIAAKRPKTMYKAIPSGSVYYFEIRSEIDKNSIMCLIKYFHEKNFSIRYEEGFGFCVMTCWED